MKDKERRFGYETTDGSTYELLLRNAKNKRRYPTPAEKALWLLLRGESLGVHFRRQHPVEGYIPDFVCLPRKLIVEVDGAYHFCNSQPLSDQERTSYLEAKGFHVLRFTNEQVLADPPSVVETIKEYLERENKDLPQPLQRRGAQRGKSSPKTSDKGESIRAGTSPNPSKGGECKEEKAPQNPPIKGSA